MTGSRDRERLMGRRKYHSNNMCKDKYDSLVSQMREREKLKVSNKTRPEKKNEQEKDKRRKERHDEKLDSRKREG